MGALSVALFGGMSLVGLYLSFTEVEEISGTRQLYLISRENERY